MRRGDRSGSSFLDAAIKDIVRHNPAVKEILDRHGIPCVSCNVGTCLLRDIAKVHSLTPERERPGGATLSPPLAALVREHDLVERVLDLVPPLIRALDDRPGAPGS